MGVASGARRNTLRNSRAITYVLGNKRYVGCGANNDIIRQAKQIDIVLNSDVNWFIDTTAYGISLGDFDFYSVILHELGHYHLLNHSLPDNKQMYWRLNDNNYKRNLHKDDVLGGLALIQESKLVVSPSCPYSPMKDSLFPHFRSNTGIKNKNFNAKSKYFKVFPNPTEQRILFIEIDEELSYVSDILVTVYSITGQSIFQKKYSNHSSKIITLTLPSRILDGLYVINFQNLDRQISSNQKIFLK